MFASTTLCFHNVVYLIVPSTKYYNRIAVAFIVCCYCFDCFALFSANFDSLILSLCQVLSVVAE